MKERARQPDSTVVECGDLWKSVWGKYGVLSKSLCRTQEAGACLLPGSHKVLNTLFCPKPPYFPLTLISKGLTKIIISQEINDIQISAWQSRSMRKGSETSNVYNVCLAKWTPHSSSFYIVLCSFYFTEPHMHFHVDNWASMSVCSFVNCTLQMGSSMQPGKMPSYL